MKKLLLAVAALATFITVDASLNGAAASVPAAQKADLLVQPLVEAARHKALRPADSEYLLSDIDKTSLAIPFERDESTYIPLMVRLTDASAAESLRAIGVDVDEVTGNIACCYVPVEVYDEMAALESVLAISPIRKYQPLNDMARAASRVDMCWAGTNLNKSYMGDGVIVGAFDGGLDPNHVNFRNDNQSASRVKRMWSYLRNTLTNKPIETEYTTASAIASFTTDDKDNTHGTHVLGIATGAYRNNTADYRGMAPHADIAIGCGMLTDDAIVKGLKRITSYAYDEGAFQPCVINVSIGSNLGHHDGSDMATEQINSIAQYAPICIAAGNEAELDIVVKKTCTANDNVIRTFLVPTPAQTASDARYQAYCTAEVIASDKTPFTLKVGLYNISTNQLVYSLEAGKNTFAYVGGNQSSVARECATNATFNNTYSNDSYMGASMGICPDNGRYYGYIKADLYNRSYNPNILPVIIVEGVAGKKYEIYNDGYYTNFSSRNVAGFTAPTKDGTLNNMACGKHTICVGAYATRNAAPIGTQVIGDIASFSSFGTLNDGRTLPHVCAPGTAIFSSFNGYYIEGSSNHSSSSEPIKLQVNYGNRRHYWSQMAGTSMATPMVTGIVALWLEANPDLYPEDIVEIINKSSKKDSYVNGGSAYSPVQWGAGKIDAYQGLCYILNGSVESVIDRGKTPILVQPLGDNRYEVFGAQESSLAVEVVSLSGATMASFTTDGDTAQVDMSGYTPGLYLLRVAGSRYVHTEKIAVN